jgi:uncharacterized DUF497 family protein
MDFQVVGFDWDHANRDKCRKHGVSIADIEAMFAKPLAVFPDPLHSRQEERFKAIGLSQKGRHIFLVFTLRKHGSDTSANQRPLHAQKGKHRKEVEHYEKETSKASQQQGG